MVSSTMGVATTVAAFLRVLDDNNNNKVAILVAATEQPTAMAERSPSMRSLPKDGLECRDRAKDRPRSHEDVDAQIVTIVGVGRL